jgi:hypothetical protein
MSCDIGVAFQRIMQYPRIAGDFATAAKNPPIGRSAGHVFLSENGV